MLKHLALFLLLSASHSGICEEALDAPHHHRHRLPLLNFIHNSNEIQSDARCACQLPTNQGNNKTPLFRNIHQWNPLSEFDTRFAYPDPYEMINSTIHTSKVQLVCANNGWLVVNSKPQPSVTSAIVKCAYLNDECTYGLYTSMDRHLADFKSFSEISCTETQVPEARMSIRVPHEFKFCNRPNNTCTACVTIDFTITEQGLVVFNSSMKSIDLIAVDASKLQPLVSQGLLVSAKHKSGNGYAGSQALKRGPIFQRTNIDLEAVFKRDYQRTRFLEIFGDQKLVDSYIPETGNFYLTAAQLISEQEFYYDVQKSSALFYENTVPVWKDVANGNWKLASEFLSKLADTKRQSFSYYSGVIDIMELADQQGNAKRIFLVRGPDGEPLIPVPKFLYKYIVARKPHQHYVHQSLVLVTVNDPRIRLEDADTMAKRGYVLPNCSPKPICQQMQPEFADPARGYTYCCSGHEFASFAEEFGLPHARYSESIL